jgi:hypothetical protein
MQFDIDRERHRAGSRFQLLAEGGAVFVDILLDCDGDGKTCRQQRRQQHADQMQAERGSRS